MLKIWVILAAVSFPLVGMADDNYSDDSSSDYGITRHADKVVPQNALYQAECGSCHFAFQANLLPSQSWKKLMLPEALANHFGDNAELNEQDRVALLNYLVANAADKKRRLLRYPKGDAPLRITELPYFKKEHREIPKRMVQGNPKVRSLVNCLACHTDAGKGTYRERNIRIPGYGYWDD